MLVPQRHRPEPRARIEGPRPRRKPRGEPVAYLLALGHRIQDAYERGELRDFYEAAARLRRTQSRISQIVSLTSLAPDIQERVLLGTLTIAETHLRKALVSADWETQRAIIRSLE